MAMSIKCIQNSPSSRRRTLRSAYKQSSIDNNPIGQSNHDKVIDQIKNQIEHQQTINASKSTYPVMDDLKVIQQQLPQKVSEPKKGKKAVCQKIKCQSSDNNYISIGGLQNSNQSHQNSLDVKLNSSQKIQKLEIQLSTPPAKSIIRNLKNEQVSPFKEQRKSYRKFKRNGSILVPYRKCQDQFQQKIVTLMNKICYRKNNEKDLDHLCQKIQKITMKDAFNPYVVSGIQTIINLLEKVSNANVTSMGKLKNQVNNMNDKIWMELGRTEQYEQIIFQQKKVDVGLTKPRLMRRIYKKLLQSRKFTVMQARQKSFSICQTFFHKCNNQASQDQILNFIKEERFLKHEH